MGSASSRDSRRSLDALLVCWRFSSGPWTSLCQRGGLRVGQVHEMPRCVDAGRSETAGVLYSVCWGDMRRPARAGE